METNIHKWGNSLGVRIPQHIARKFYLNNGSVVELSIQDDHITIYPKKYNLADMLEQITEENKHDIIDNTSEGQEEW